MIGKTRKAGSALIGSLALAKLNQSMDPTPKKYSLMIIGACVSGLVYSMACMTWMAFNPTAVAMLNEAAVCGVPGMCELMMSIIDNR